MKLAEFIPSIAISVGDINGIGPEIILKSLQDIDLKTSTPMVIAPEKVLRYYLDALSIDVDYKVANGYDDIQPGIINVLTGDFISPQITPGSHSTDSGKIAMQSIEKGIDLCLTGTAHALVTAPISKEAVNLAGYHIPGHTEFLAQKTGTGSVLMMLVNEGLRVSLVTTHIPLRAVAEAITPKRITNKLEILNASLKHDFGITSPRIAVLGLNPHAGDGGVIGDEEMNIITPTLKQIRGDGIHADGPFPADGFFGQKLHEKYDAVLAMYHDQGLAPFKLLSFGKGVNFTAGLPIVRASPDHGTAFDIAGKGIANSSSFKQAYNLAVDLAHKRFKTRDA